MYKPVIDAGVQMTTRDGVTLTGDLYRPKGDGKWPVLVHRTPYDRTDPYKVSGIVADPLWLARQGYAVLVQDVRGRFGSGGEFDFIDQEYNDSYDTIDWAASQPWSNGDVGIYGSSYLGMTVLQAVSARHPNLKAAVALIGTADMQHTARPGGLFELGFLATYGLGLVEAGLDHSSLGADEQEQARKALGAVLADRFTGVSELPLTDIATLDDHRVAPFWTDWLRSPHDPFWNRPTLLNEPERVAIPFLQITGYRDFCSPTQFRLAGKLAGNENASMIAGPWTHMGTYVPFGQIGSRVLPNAAAGVPIWGQVLAAFFDKNLRGGDGSEYPLADRYLAGPGRVTYFVGGSNDWSYSEAWPPPSVPTDWLLASDGDARSSAGNGRLVTAGAPELESPSDTFTADPKDPFPTHGGAAMFDAGGGAALPEGIQDQRDVDQRGDVLVYTSEPLADDLTMAGRAELIVHITSSAPDADVCVTLVDVEPGGFAEHVAEGAQRARYRDGSDTAWLDPQQPSEVTVMLNDVAHTFRRGHRIRLQIAGFNFPRFSRNLHTRTVPEFGTLDEAVSADHTIHHASSYPSVLRLPVLES